MKRARWLGWVIGFSILSLAFAPMVALLATPAERSYAFVPDHPVDLWQDGSDRWAYYFVHLGDSSKLLKQAKPILLAEGFKENGSRASWNRFTKGDQEVIVYDSGVNAFDRSGKRSPMPKGIEATHTQCVLVKNGPGTHDSLEFFKAKKLLHGW